MGHFCIDLTVAHAKAQVRDKYCMLLRSRISGTSESLLCGWRAFGTSATLEAGEAPLVAATSHRARQSLTAEVTQVAWSGLLHPAGCLLVFNYQQALT